jgi:hypothetical protein
MSCYTVLNALIVVIGVSLSLEKAMKKIASTDGTIATKVRAILGLNLAHAMPSIPNIA